jgi:4-carboxymuconolactone decarboxylase
VTEPDGRRASIAELRAEVLSEFVGATSRVAPDVRDLAASFAYGQVWSRPQLSPRERSVATIAALAAVNCPDELKLHVLRGLANGLSKVEIGELFTHLVPYLGFPASTSLAAAVSGLVERADVGEAADGPGS